MGYYMNEDDNSPSLLEQSGTFILSAEFDSCLAKDVITWIFESNLRKDKNYKNLTLIINSPGGELTDAFAIIDAMNGSCLPVHTIGLGQICSSGFLTFIAGAHRILTPNTCVMCHQYSWWYGGKHSELISARKEQDLMEKRMLNHITYCTGMSVKDVKKYLLRENDTYLSGEEALNLGICEEVKDLTQ